MSANAINANAVAGSSRFTNCWIPTDGNSSGGMPPSTWPTVAMSRDARSTTAAIAKPRPRTTSDGGIIGRNRLTAKATASNTTLSTTVGPLADPNSTTISFTVGRKSLATTSRPRSFSIWPEITITATPLMYPRSTGLPKKSPTNPRCSSPARNSTAPIARAKAAASVA